MTFGAPRCWEPPEQPALGPEMQAHRSGTLLHSVGECSSPPWVTRHPAVVPEAPGGWAASQGGPLIEGEVCRSTVKPRRRSGLEVTQAAAGLQPRGTLLCDQAPSLLWSQLPGV